MQNKGVAKTGTRDARCPLKGYPSESIRNLNMVFKIFILEYQTYIWTAYKRLWGYKSLFSNFLLHIETSQDETPVYAFIHIYMCT